jgi:DNA polymerase-3 subunit delta
MYKKEFDALLQNGTLPKSLMLFGDSAYFIDHYTRACLERLPQSSSVLKMYYQDYEPKNALAHLQNGSLFDDANILIIQTDKKIPKKELDPIIESAIRNENSFFILKYYAPDAKDKQKIFIKKNMADFVRFFAPAPHEATAVLRSHAQRLHMKIGDHALNHILAINHNNLELSVNELEKLAVHSDEIDIKTIDKVIQGNGDFDMNDFFEELLNKKNITRKLQLLIERGEDEVRILNMFQSYVTQLMLFTMSAKIIGKVDSKEVLGYKLPLQLEQQRGAMAVKLNAKIYHQLLSTLQECEYLIKTSQGDKKSLLFSTLIRIQTKIV